MPPATTSPRTIMPAPRRARPGRRVVPGQEVGIGDVGCATAEEQPAAGHGDAGQCRAEPGQQAGRQVGQGRGGVSVTDPLVDLDGEGGEGGEAAAEAHGHQGTQPPVTGPALGDQGDDHPEDERADDVDPQGGPGEAERVGGHGPLHAVAGQGAERTTGGDGGRRPGPWWGTSMRVGRGAVRRRRATRAPLRSFRVATGAADRAVRVRPPAVRLPRPEESTTGPIRFSGPRRAPARRGCLNS